MRITDQPGRYVAVFIVAPLLFYVAMCLEKHHETTLARIVCLLACVFLLYEVFWIMCYPPNEMYVTF